MKNHRDKLKKSPFLLIQNSRSSLQCELNNNVAVDEQNVIQLPTLVTAAENSTNDKNQNSAIKHYHANRSFSILPGLDCGVVCALPIRSWERVNSNDDVDNLESYNDSARSNVNYQIDTFVLNEGEEKINHHNEPSLAVVRVRETNDIFQLICDTKNEQTKDTMNSLIDRLNTPRNLYFNQKFWKYFCDYRQLLQCQKLKSSDEVASVVRIPYSYDYDGDQSQSKDTLQSNSQLLHQEDQIYGDDYVVVDTHMLAVLEQSMKVEVLFEWNVLKKAKENGEISLSKIWDLIRTVKNIVPLIEKDEILSHNPYKINFNQFVGFVQSFEKYMYDLRTSPPRVEIHIVQAKEKSITISLKSDRSCLLIISVYHSHKTAPTMEAMKRLSQTKHAQWKKLHIRCNDVHELEFGSLNHGTKYKMYLYWELNISEYQKTINSSNFDIVQSCVEFETNEEICSKILLPSWCELEETEQRIEILAAIRDQKIVLECSKDNVYIPSVSEDLGSTDILNDDSWKKIIDWWREHEDIRYSFCFREVKYAARDEETRFLAKEEGIEIAPGDWNSTDEKKTERWQQFCWWYYGTTNSYSKYQSDSESHLPLRHKSAFLTEHKLHIVQPLSKNIFLTFPGKTVTERHKFYKKSQMADLMNKCGTLEVRFTFNSFVYGNYNDKNEPEEEIYGIPYAFHGEKLSSWELSRHIITTVALSFVASIFKNVLQEDMLSNCSNFFTQKRNQGPYNAVLEKFIVDPLLSTNLNRLESVITKDSTNINKTFNTRNNESNNFFSSSPQIISRQDVKSPRISVNALVGESPQTVTDTNLHEQEKQSFTINEHASSTPSISLSPFNGVRKARQMFLNSRINKVDTVSNSVKKLVALTSKKKSLKGIQLLRAKAKLVILTKKLEKIGVNRENFASKDHKTYELDLFQDFNDGELDFDPFEQKKRRSSRSPIVNVKECIGKQKKPSPINDGKRDDIDHQNSIERSSKFYYQRLLRFCFNAMRRLSSLNKVEDGNKNGKDNDMSFPIDVSSNVDLSDIGQNALSGIDTTTKFENEEPLLQKDTLERDVLGWERRMFAWEEYLSHILQVHTRDQKRLSQNKSAPPPKASVESDLEISSVLEAFDSLGLQNLIDDCPDYFERASVLTGSDESVFYQILQEDRCNTDKMLLYEKDYDKTFNQSYASTDKAVDDFFSGDIWQKRHLKTKPTKGSDTLTSPSPSSTAKYRIVTSFEQKQMDCEGDRSADFLKHQRDVSFQERKCFANEDSYSTTIRRQDVLDKFSGMHSKKYERVSLWRRKRSTCKTAITRRLRKRNDIRNRNCVNASRTLCGKSTMTEIIQHGGEAVHKSNVFSYEPNIELLHFIKNCQNNRFKYKNCPPISGLVYDCRKAPLRISYNVCSSKKKGSFPMSIDKLIHCEFSADKKIDKSIRISISEPVSGQNKALNQKSIPHSINISLMNTSKVPYQGQCFENLAPFTSEKTKGFFIKGNSTG